MIATVHRRMTRWSRATRTETGRLADRRSRATVRLMKTTLLGVFLVAVGAASMIGGATGAPILIAMFGGMRGRATDTVLTRAGMSIGGLLVLGFGVLLVSGYISTGASTTP